MKDAKNIKGLFIAESSIGIHRPLAKEVGLKMISFTVRPSYQSIMVPITDICSQSFVSVTNYKALRIEGIDKPSEILYYNYNKDIISMLRDMYREMGECNIYLAQDNDASGHFMAAILYYHLINAGVDKNKIIRTPLFSFGYNYETIQLGMSIFYAKHELLTLLELDRAEQRKMNGNKKVPRGNVGYRKDAALAHLMDRCAEKNPQTKKISEGTGYCTYITKKLLDEKN